MDSFIEIDSTYRNRSSFPISSNFDVLVGERKTNVQAEDPVCLSSSINEWVSNNFNNAIGSSSITGIIINTTSVGLGGAGNQKTILQVTEGGAGELQNIDNYYKNAILVDNAGASYKILNYKYMGNGRAQITTVSTTTIQSPISIFDPSDISDTTNSFFFVPNGKDESNSYVNYIIYNESTNTSANILSYDSLTGLIKISDITGLGWSLTPQQIYSIRYNSPLIGTINNNTSSTNVLSISSDFQNIDDFYKNGFVKMTSGPSSQEIRKISKYISLEGNSSGGSLTTVNLPILAVARDDYYTNCYIQILSGAAIGDVRQIVSYNNKIATVGIPFSNPINIGDQFSIKSVFVSEPFVATVTSGNEFQLMPFSYDNHNPINFTNSIVSNQQEVCYEMNLVSLILPNKLLKSGGLTKYLPYIYVEFYNLNLKTKGAIYSNNPNAKTALFKCPIYDTDDICKSKYLKLSSPIKIKTKFKANDNFHFSVKLPDGQYLTFEEEEDFSPLKPNSEIQISAVFGIAKVSLYNRN